MYFKLFVETTFGVSSPDIEREWVPNLKDLLQKMLCWIVLHWSWARYTTQ